MALLHAKRREYTCQVLYWGPGLSGKSATVHWLAAHAPPGRAGTAVRLACESRAQPAAFDFLPLSLGAVHEVDVRLHLYTTPGHVHCDRTRRSLLQRCDAVVFVADSHPDRQEANWVSAEELHEALRERGGPVPAPLALQCNKQDLAEAVPVATLAHHFGSPLPLAFASQASRGAGLLEPLLAVTGELLHACGFGA